MRDPISNVDRADAVAFFGDSSVRMLLNVDKAFVTNKRNLRLLQRKLESYMTIVSDGVWQELTGKQLPSHVAIQIAMAGNTPRETLDEIYEFARGIVSSDERIEIEFVS